MLTAGIHTRGRIDYADGGAFTKSRQIVCISWRISQLTCSMGGAPAATLCRNNVQATTFLGPSTTPKGLSGSGLHTPAGVGASIFFDASLVAISDRAVLILEREAGCRLLLSQYASGWYACSTVGTSLTLLSAAPASRGLQVVHSHNDGLQHQAEPRCWLSGISKIE